jgi:hypothetical protein
MVADAALFAQRKTSPRHSYLRASLFASWVCDGGRPAGCRPTVWDVSSRLIWRPALAGIGDGCPWMVLMISLLSIPRGRCRDPEVGMPRSPARRVSAWA